MSRAAIVTAALAVLAACSGKRGGSAAEEEQEAAQAPGPSPFTSFAETAPRVGERAPPFELRAIDGGTVKLADAVAKGPVVLVSGSYSCPLFRMKTPRFEELARRWQGVATVLFVYVDEAHPKAASSERLQGFADKVRALDKNGDGAITLEEYGTTGPRYMFDAFDVDHDGIVRSHEIIAAQRIDQFRNVPVPQTIEQRTALARNFRAEVPGAIRVVVDPLDNPTAKAYGPLPNFAYVIGKDGTVTFKQGWAAVRDVERELRRLTQAAPSAPPREPDLSELPASAGRPILVELVAPGCAACARVEEALETPDVARALRAYEVVKLSVDEDPAWRLFDELGLAATPAFVIVDRGAVVRRVEGAITRDRLLAFLR
ncbi:MAG: thioredoxin family protein [Deltaproteobacteria bacterium]|nr:thioredoxin family protein [Deltaproteobacteria bacterium]